MGITIAVHGGPFAVRLARRELAGIALIIEALDKTVNPSEAQSFINGILIGDTCATRVAFVEDQPHFGFRSVMFGKPRPPLLQRCGIESLRSFRVHCPMPSRRQRPKWCGLAYPIA